MGEGEMERATIINGGEEAPTPANSLEKINRILMALEKPGDPKTAAELAAAEEEINRLYKFLEPSDQLALEERVAEALKRE
ncbi:MAG: hypothetical protein NTZ18_02445 [Candidatus Komeilibacteria bacterium]|nr:hypothetical protein [Candidatus Komeilibacteria bacterium]